MSTTPSLAEAAQNPSLLDRLAEFCRIIALSGLVIITLVQAWQVFARYVLNNSPGWTEPVSVFFMAMTVMMAAAVGVREGTHFSFSNVLDAMPAKLRFLVRQGLQLIIIAVALTLAFWGFQLAIGNWDVVMAGAPLPAGIRYLPFALGASIMSIFAIERLIVPLKLAGE
jgi:TRAP-type C4-dicarboxylate transport system permease small subunit